MRRGPIPWRMAEVRELAWATPRVRLIHLHVPDWPGHAAGQHVDLRLTAEDGYQAQRSYSIATAPDHAPLLFVCGPTPMVESVASLLVSIGHPAGRVKTERFGATGGVR